MTLIESFDSLQRTVDADVEVVRLARERRDTFKAALRGADDVLDVWGSGSLRRSTQLQPVHDVDLVVEFDTTAHPDWGVDGPGAAAALERCRELVTELLGINHGSEARLVRQVRTAGRNRAAKCFIDPPEEENAFTVDVMPALAQTSGILIPFVQQDRWSLADPQYLIDLVAERQQTWSRFRPLVRLLKYWSRQHTAVTGKVKSLAIEVLALDCLQEAPNRAAALRGFFEAAALHSLQIDDPAGLSGPIQPDLDRAGLRRALEDAAADAATALDLAGANDESGASLRWQAIFGSAFPLIAAASGGAAAAPAPRPVRDSPQG